MKGEIKTIYLTAYSDELFEPAFEDFEDANKFVSELNRQYRETKGGWGSWEVRAIELYPSSTYDFCLEEGCNNSSDGYFFCASCLEKRQGSS